MRNAVDILIIITAVALVIAVFIVFCAGCGTLPRQIRHEVQREAGKVVKYEFKREADAWALDWLVKVCVALAGAGGLSGSGALVMHIRGKRKQNGNGNGKG